MKFDDFLNGAIAILLGAAMIAGSRGMSRVAHIEYGPGFFPAIAGTGLIIAGLVLIVSRAVFASGAIDNLVSLRAKNWRGLLGFFIVLTAILGYILFADVLGFFIVAPIFLFTLVFWFERRLGLSLAVAVLGTFIFHSFFYQFMSAPLPWGLLEPWSGRLTW